MGPDCLLRQHLQLLSHLVGMGPQHHRAMHRLRESHVGDWHFERADRLYHVGVSDSYGVGAEYEYEAEDLAELDVRGGVLCVYH